jgi:bifunctional N-acetylglucosamine-1-phosphate-uridyltransferase/glucosamine-1-phosphate-acetyltransferase GlmU-like protein
MTRRLLLVPAAGLGSRLGAAVPKLLVTVAGTPMIDRIERLYREVVSKVVVIVHPSFDQVMREHVGAWETPAEIVVQRQPTGMLDAILLGSDAVRSAQADGIWVSWCDQVAVHPSTVRTLAETSDSRPDAALIMPTVRQRMPYIHLERDATRRIVRVLHRREGDEMPDLGESDMGLFALSRHAYLDLLPQYEVEVSIGHLTRERNFLPFIPWVAARDEVVTFPSVDQEEAIGVNTREELAFVERYLAARDGSGT